MTPTESDALRVADRCVRAVTGYGIAEAMRESEGNPEVSAALELLRPVWGNQDRGRN